MIKDLVIGQRVEGLFCILNSLKESDGAYFATFKDRDSSIPGRIISELLDDTIKSIVGSAVKISAVVIPGKETAPMLNVKSIAKANPGEFNPLDLTEGLSEEKVREYKEIIRICIKQIQHPGYKELVERLLSEDNLNRLATIPASLAYYGKYRGGALAGAALISIMCRDTGVEYVRHFNAIHQRNIDWSLLLTGSLLNTIGTLIYITPEAPYTKTVVGMDKGYVGVTQSIIEKTIYQNQIPITEEECARLINVITCAVATKTDIRNSAKEGIILRHCLALYAELDMLDYAFAEHEKSDENEQFFYAPNLKRYIAS